MQKYSEKDMFDFIESCREMNFFADVVTPLHVLGVEAAIYHLASEGVKLKGCIAVMAHSLTGYAVSEESFHVIDGVDTKLVQMSTDYIARSFSQKLQRRWKRFRFYAKLRKPEPEKPVFYYITPYKPSFDTIIKLTEIKSGYRLQIIVTDEGLANYIRSPYGIQKCIIPEWGFYWTLKNVWTILVEERRFVKQVRKAGMISDFTILWKQQGKWVPNPACVEAYKAILSQNAREGAYPYYGGAVLLNASLLYETKILKKPDDIRIYKEIGRELKQMGIPLVAKPHPREKELSWYEDLDCIVEKESAISQEAILASLNVLPKCVIGDSSTTLVTSAVLFGIKTISISRLINKKYLYDAHYFDGFDKSFSNLVLMPESMEELKNMLERL